MYSDQRPVTRRSKIMTKPKSLIQIFLPSTNPPKTYIFHRPQHTRALGSIPISKSTLPSERREIHLPFSNPQCCPRPCGLLGFALRAHSSYKMTSDRFNRSPAPVRTLRTLSLHDFRVRGKALCSRVTWGRVRLVDGQGSGDQRVTLYFYLFGDSQSSTREHDVVFISLNTIPLRSWNLNHYWQGKE